MQVWTTRSTPGSSLTRVLDRQTRIPFEDLESAANLDVKNHDTVSNDDRIPLIGTSEEIDAKISVYELVERTKEETASWAQQGNTDSIPTEKLANAGRTGGQTEGLTQPQVDQRINSLSYRRIDASLRAERKAKFYPRHPQPTSIRIGRMT